MHVTTSELEMAFVQAHRQLAVETVGERAGECAEGHRRLGIGDMSGQLRLLRGVGAFALHERTRVRLAAPVLHRRAELAIEHVLLEEPGKLCALHVAQHHDANFLLGEHADSGGHAERVSAVLPGELVSIILNHPAHAVRAEALHGDGIGSVTCPVAAHSVPRASVVMKPTQRMPFRSWPIGVWNTRPLP